MTWGARRDSSAPSAAGAPLPPSGKHLGKLNAEDLKAIIEKGIKYYGKYLLGNKGSFNKDIHSLISTFYVMTCGVNQNP